jgi:hypothetical protein
LAEADIRLTPFYVRFRAVERTSRGRRASADVTKYLKTFWNVARTVPPSDMVAKADDLQGAIDWLTAAQTATGIATGLVKTDRD